MPAVTASAVATPSPVSLKPSAVSVDTQIDVSALFVADKAARAAAAKTLAATAQKNGPAALQSVQFAEAVVKAFGDKKSPAAREGAAEAISALVSGGAASSLEPIFINSGIYNALLEAFADKMPAVKTAAVEAVRGYVAAMNPWATSLVLPALLHEIKTASKWQVKTGSLVVL